MEEKMHIFVWKVWKASEKNGSCAKVFMTQADAWDAMKEICLCDWPDFIIEFNGDPTENSNFVMKPLVFVEQMMS